MIPKRKKKKDPVLLEPLPDGSAETPRPRILRLLLIAILVILLVYWMTFSSKPKPNSPETVSQGENSPDAIIEKLHLVSTIQGQKRWEMNADSARLYQGQKQAYADTIYGQFFKKEKLVSTLTADKAIINTESNATQAEGHVELVTENGSKLETEKLNWDPASDEIKTDARVHIFKGTDDITAMGMVADTQLNNIRFMKDVHTQVRDTSVIEDFSKKKKF
jgi:LPS export ABC transporter protein LptC